MQPKMLDQLPLGPNWFYEIKYDGFRTEIIWSEQDIQIKGRRGTDLTLQFPEIFDWCKKKEHLIINELPIVFDGELVILNTKIQANFSLLQTRGRLRTTETIRKHAMKRPAHLLCFDLLTKQGRSLRNRPYKERKEQLDKVFKQLLGFTEAIQWKERLGYVTSSKEPDNIHRLVSENLGEGIIASIYILMDILLNVQNVSSLSSI
ncbi:hypothetical protein [Paraliobacillus sp. PM-2]|uniref:ATP-dependent DNA ligase n=1 Tax=Paraliobacillus sp. PM-2 TaxID=1462524 RepID=UPI0021000C41|nr:hypothetical protein [Paraliobacillus sp. PM-2]